MLDSGSSRSSQAYSPLERDRNGAVPLALPTDGFPRPEAFSQLVHLKGVRAQRELYPRASFNAALEVAAVSGLECYRFRTFRSFVNHVPIALVPRGSNVVLAHIPAVLSQAADAVLALGHRLYFEVEGPLRSIVDEDSCDDDDPGFGHPLRGGGSNPGSRSSIGGGSCSGSGTISQKGLAAAAAPPPSPGLTRTRSGSIGGYFNMGSSLSLSGGRPAAWEAGSTTNDGGCSNSNGTGNSNGNNDTLALPDRRGSLGTASLSAASIMSSLPSSILSTSSIKSSASSSLRTLRTLLSARYSSSSRALRYSEAEIELGADPRVTELEDDGRVTLAGGGRFSLDKLAVAVSIFADGEEGVQAYLQELGQRGVQTVASEFNWRPGPRPCR